MKRPNRIDYIVYRNPKGVQKLIYKEGYEPPKNLIDLVKVTKILIRKLGKEFIKKLILLHPDRKAILQIDEPAKDCGCLACGHQSFKNITNKGAFLDRLMGMGTVDLDNYYSNLNQKIKENPEDKYLDEEIQLVWDELRQRKKQEKNITVSEPEERKGLLKAANDTLFALGLTLLAGILIGTSLHLKTND